MTNPYSAKQWLQLNMQQQGLLQPAPSLNTLLQQLSYIQIDSINVVERAHHHVLQSRMPNYTPTMLDEAMANKTVFEYWSHAAAYLPINDYRFSLYRKQQLQQGGKHWFEPEHKVMREVKARISTEGPLKANQFQHESDTQNGTWWDWKPAKKALEQLFMEGELMAVKRQGFQKVYDLTERALPAGIDTSVPTEQEFYRYLITRCLQANGLASASEIAYLRKGIKRKVETECVNMFEDGELQQLECQGQLYYALPNVQKLLSQPLKASQVKILSPFDNLLIQRKRMQQLFDFDYQIECYVPEPKRQYGYFSLPLLWGSGFAGRMDAKIERKTGLLSIQHLHIETPKIEAFIQNFLPALREFLLLNKGCHICVNRLSASDVLSDKNLKACRQMIENLSL